MARNKTDGAANPPDGMQHFLRFPEDAIPPRLPEEVTHNGRNLKAILQDHMAYIAGDSAGKLARLCMADLTGVSFRGYDLSGADLAFADLAEADLSETCLEQADLHGVRGNGLQVKYAHFDTWPIVWTRSPEGDDYIQIGCHRRLASTWAKADRRYIEVAAQYAHPEQIKIAVAWWEKHKDHILGAVVLSPARPWANPKPINRNSKGET